MGLFDRVNMSTVTKHDRVITDILNLGGLTNDDKRDYYNYKKYSIFHPVDSEIVCTGGADCNLMNCPVRRSSLNAHIEY